MDRLYIIDLNFDTDLFSVFTALLIIGCLISCWRVTYQTGQHQLPLLLIVGLFLGTQVLIPNIGYLVDNQFYISANLFLYVLVCQSLSFFMLHYSLCSTVKSYQKRKQLRLTTIAKQTYKYLMVSGLVGLYVLLVFAKGFSVLNPFGNLGGYHGNDVLTVMANSLATLLLVPLLAAPHFRVKRRPLIYLFGAYAYFHLLTGSRYRIIILMIGMVILYLIPNFQRQTFAVRVRTISLSLVVIYCMMLWSANRWALANKRFEYLTLNPFANGASLISEFNQPQVAAKVLDFSDHNGLGPDYGSTMFGHLFYKAVPKPVLEHFGLAGPDGLGESAKIYPPMLQRLNLANGGFYYKGMPAIGGLHEVFLSYSGWAILVLVVAGIFIGEIINWSRKLKILAYLPRNFIITLFVMWSFQWLTRGYLPHQLELAWLLFLPLLATEIGFRILSVTQTSKS